jgi:hypothetical protein
MINFCICWFLCIFLLGILIFKGLTARRLYKSFGIKGLSRLLNAMKELLKVGTGCLNSYRSKVERMTVAHVTRANVYT